MTLESDIASFLSLLRIIDQVAGQQTVTASRSDITVGDPGPHPPLGLAVDVDGDILTLGNRPVERDIQIKSFFRRSADTRDKHSGLTFTHDGKQ